MENYMLQFFDSFGDGCDPAAPNSIYFMMAHLRVPVVDDNECIKFKRKTFSLHTTQKSWLNNFLHEKTKLYN